MTQQLANGVKLASEVCAHKYFDREQVKNVLYSRRSLSECMNKLSVCVNHEDLRDSA